MDNAFTDYSMPIWKNQACDTWMTESDISDHARHKIARTVPNITCAYFPDSRTHDAIDEGGDFAASSGHAANGGVEAFDPPALGFDDSEILGTRQVRFRMDRTGHMGATRSRSDAEYPIISPLTMVPYNDKTAIHRRLMHVGGGGGGM